MEKELSSIVVVVVVCLVVISRHLECRCSSLAQRPTKVEPSRGTSIIRFPEAANQKLPTARLTMVDKIAGPKLSRQLLTAGKSRRKLCYC